MKTRILLTYCMYGNGHRAVANYIEHYCKKQDPEWDIKSIDLLEYGRPFLSKFTQKATDFFLLKFPLGWSFFYDLFDHRITSDFGSKSTVMGIFNNKRLRKVITDFDPDMVISTHFYGGSLIDYYNRKGITNAKLITVVTDYEAHAFWLKGTKTEQAIIVSDKNEVSALVRKGVNRSIIKPIGIPIAPDTSEGFNKTRYIKKLGFSGKRPICLFFGGGGNGGTHSLPFIKKLIKANLNIDFIYVAGKNARSKRLVDNWIYEYGATNFRTFGFVTNVPELLQVCDFVVSKPGGAQTTESLYFKKPVVMINCSGGQERANYKYFEKNGYGRFFRFSFTFAHYIKYLSFHPDEIKRMSKNMLKNRNNEAMEKLYNLAKGILK